MTPEWTMSSDGEVSVPQDVPGIGVDVDVERIEALTSYREDIER